MAPFMVPWAVPILEPPKGATKNPLGGFLGKKPFKNPYMGFFERTLQGSFKPSIGCCKKTFEGSFFIAPCGIPEGFFEEPLGFRNRTLRVL